MNTKIYKKGCGCSFKIIKKLSNGILRVQFVNTCPKFEMEKNIKNEYERQRKYARHDSLVDQELLKQKLKNGKIQVDVIRSLKEIENDD